MFSIAIRRAVGQNLGTARPNQQNTFFAAMSRNNLVKQG